MTVPDPAGRILARVAYQYTGSFMHPAELDPRAWPDAYALPNVTDDDRRTLAGLADTSWDRARAYYDAGRITGPCWEAYLALWWYGAPRFQERPSQWPYVREVNAWLDAGGTAETWIAREHGR